MPHSLRHFHSAFQLYFSRQLTTSHQRFDDAAHPAFTSVGVSTGSCIVGTRSFYEKGSASAVRNAIIVFALHKHASTPIRDHASPPLTPTGDFATFADTITGALPFTPEDPRRKTRDRIPTLAAKTKAKARIPGTQAIRWRTENSCSEAREREEISDTLKRLDDYLRLTVTSVLLDFPMLRIGSLKLIHVAGLTKHCTAILNNHATGNR